MDSIVDAFFPLINFIEGESNEVATFLADPLNTPQQLASATDTAAPLAKVSSPRVYDNGAVGIGVADASHSEKSKGSFEKADHSGVRKATIRRHAATAVLRFLPTLHLPTFATRLLPRAWLGSATKTFETSMLVDGDGYELQTLSARVPVQLESVPVRSSAGSAFIGDTRFNRSVMLKRIADMRTLVTGLTRLLGPKMDVVRGLRKRAKEDALPPILQLEARQDISIYLGDLYGKPWGSSGITRQTLIAIVESPRRSYPLYATDSQFLRGNPLSRSPCIYRRAAIGAHQCKGWNGSQSCQIVHRHFDLLASQPRDL